MSYDQPKQRDPKYLGFWFGFKSETQAQKPKIGSTASINLIMKLIENLRVILKRSIFLSSKTILIGSGLLSREFILSEFNCR